MAPHEEQNPAGCGEALHSWVPSLQPWDTTKTQWRNSPAQGGKEQILSLLLRAQSRGAEPRAAAAGHTKGQPAGAQRLLSV